MTPYNCIVNDAPDSGTYAWSVPSDIEPKALSYGIQIIASGSGNYQYSVLFSVEKGKNKPSSATSELTSKSKTTTGARTSNYVKPTGTGKYYTSSKHYNGTHSSGPRPTGSSGFYSSRNSTRTTQKPTTSQTVITTSASVSSDSSLGAVTSVAFATGSGQAGAGTVDVTASASGQAASSTARTGGAVPTAQAGMWGAGVVGVVGLVGGLVL